MNWFKVAEVGGWILAAIGTFMGGFFGTRNAAQERVDEFIEKGKEAKSKGSN